MVPFGSCDTKISQKEASENSESRTTFALLIEIYQPSKFHQFSFARSREIPERGGVPLNDYETNRNENNEWKLENFDVIKLDKEVYGWLV